MFFVPSALLAHNRSPDAIFSDFFCSVEVLLKWALSVTIIIGTGKAVKGVRRFTCYECFEISNKSTIFLEKACCILLYFKIRSFIKFPNQKEYMRIYSYNIGGLAGLGKWG